MMEMIEISGVIIPGHQVASGSNRDPKFPGGTLSMQLPHFKERGLDLSGYHLATINVSIAPREFKIKKADWVFENVNWHPHDPPETFSFVEVEVSGIKGLIYYPHPETKPAHFQPVGLIEIILEEFVPDLGYGNEIKIQVPKSRIEIIEPTC